MLLPLSTDAPIYHFPRATLGLIAVNVICFVLTGFGDADTHTAWLLSFGDGLHPLQWVSCAFFHFGWLHLVGNMFFLWAFGLVVEGKIGWQRFLTVYAGIMLIHGLLEQTLMLAHDGGESAGASGVVYGLLAMALVWAPANEFQCLWLVIRIQLVDVTIVMFSGFYLTIQFLIASATGFPMSSEVIHLLGAVLGFIVATVMLKRGTVDCENWDLFAWMSGTHGDPDRFNSAGRHDPGTVYETSGLSSAVSDEDESERLAGRRSKLRKRLRRMLGDGKPDAAHRVFMQLEREFPDTRLNEAEMAALIEGLYTARVWQKVGPLLEQFVQRFPDQSGLMRIRLARLVIELQNRPRAALRILEAISPDDLDDQTRGELQSLTLTASDMIDDGVIEMQNQGWQ